MGAEGWIKTRSPFVHVTVNGGGRGKKKKKKKKGAGVNALKNNHIDLNGLDRQD